MKEPKTLTSEGNNRIIKNRWIPDNKGDPQGTLTLEPGRNWKKTGCSKCYFKNDQASPTTI